MKSVKGKNIWAKIEKNSVIILITLIIISLLFMALRYRSGHNEEIIIKTIKEKVENIIELSTVKYNYTDVINFEDSLKLNGVDLPFTEKNFTIKYGGYLKAGVDLKSIDIDIKNKDIVEISMDKAVILENVINEEDVYFFNEKDGLFNKLYFKDLYSVLVGQKKNIEKETIDRGLLNEAEKNAEEILHSLLGEMKFKSIIVKFK